MANVNFFSPDGGITRYPLEDTEGRIMYADDIDGINLLHPTNSSITTYGSTITYNADGTVSKSGTVSGGNAQYGFAVPTNAAYAFPAELEAGKEYILSGCPTGGADGTYEIYIQFRNADNTAWGATYHDYGEGVRFTATGARFGVYVRIFNGNTDTLVFEPMITEAKYAGIPYRPYNQQSIQHQINAQTGVLGAKNLLDNKATTQIVNGVTWTVNADKSISSSGATTTNRSEITINSGMVLPAGSYKATGCAQGGSNNPFTYQIVYRKDSASGTMIGIDTGEGLEFTLAEATTIVAYILVNVNINMNGKVFKPMIRLATDPDDTYVPKAMTNRELTERLTNITNTTISQAFTDETIYENTGRTGGDSKYVIKNGICFLHLYVTAKNPVTTDTYVGIDLPIPQTTGVFIFGQLVSSSGDSLMVGVRNRSSNNLMLTGGVANRKYYGTIIYPVDL